MPKRKTPKTDYELYEDWLRVSGKVCLCEECAFFGGLDAAREQK